jgi:hypothetical protein
MCYKVRFSLGKGGGIDYPIGGKGEGKGEGGGEGGGKGGKGGKEKKKTQKHKNTKKTLKKGLFQVAEVARGLSNPRSTSAGVINKK